jgi:dGTPase
MTHTLEVARIARTISRALMLNEDLTEAAALGHDIGHTPFGHAGERALKELCGEFKHYEQSLRVVDRLEKDGRGLNLSNEVRMAILNHTTGAPGDTLEAKCVRLADRIAYINHDVDDALRAGILTIEDLPMNVRKTLGESHSVRINTITDDLIKMSYEKDDLRMSPEIQKAVDEFHEFLYEMVYWNPRAKSEESKVGGVLGGIYDYFIKNSDKLPEDYKALVECDGLERVVVDYVAGMTDKFAISKYSELYIPASWHVI